MIGISAIRKQIAAIWEFINKNEQNKQTTKQTSKIFVGRTSHSLRRKLLSRLEL